MNPLPGFPVALGEPPPDQSWASQMSGYVVAFLVGSVAGFVACKFLFPADDGGWKDKYDDAENRAMTWEQDYHRLEKRVEERGAMKDKRIAELEKDRAGWRDIAEGGRR